MTYPPSPWPEPATNTPIAWQVWTGSTALTYVGVRIPSCGWYVTGRPDVPQPLSWAALCYHFTPADGRFLLLSVSGQVTL